MNISEVAKKENLNLIEISILIELEKKYPQTVSIEESKKDEVEKYIINLKQKGYIEQRFQKYRIKR